MAGFFSPATLEQVRAASDIVDIIGAYVPLKRAGGSFVALCPFHKEKTPSFHVNPSRQIFHCFGCQKGGDVFAFVKEYENIDFPDAVRRLAERARIPLETDAQGDRLGTRHVKDRLLQLHEQITQHWQSSLSTNPAASIARDYLVKRGLSPDAIAQFRLGFAPPLWDDTVNWARSKNFEPELVEQAGLIVKKPETGQHYDRFRGRLMFPICDEQGRVIGFSGRILSEEDKTAKYVNSPESPLFTKGRVMYGLDKSKRILLEKKCAIICEGQLDLIACFTNGVQNVVAPQGTALTGDHARILKRYVEEVVLCFDADEAGQNAAVRSLDSLLAAGLAVRVAVLPAPHDPDSFIKTVGGPAFAQLIESAPGFFDYYLNRLCQQQDVKSDRGQRAVVQAMAQAVRKTGNAVLMDTYAQKTAVRLSVAAQSVRDEFKKSTAVPMASNDEEENENPAPSLSVRPSQAECWLLRFLLETDDYVEWIESYLELEWLPHPLVREIVGQRLTARASQSWLGLAPWLSELENEEGRILITGILADDRVSPTEKNIKGIAARDSTIKILRDKYIELQVAGLNQRLLSSELAEEEQHQILIRLQEWRSAKKLPLAPKPLPGDA